MKYYLIVGEASGDLHASHLIRSLKNEDPKAEFRFFGGDLMAAEAGTAGTRVRHYRELAYMGFIPVLLHLPTILNNMRQCKRDIAAWQPDAVILVDYPGFNLSIAKYVKQELAMPASNKGRRGPKVYYYISPKIWAWKEWRIKSIRRNVDELFSILPFEVPFFEQKHHYPIHYVGNPTADEVRKFLNDSHQVPRSLSDVNDSSATNAQPVIALLAGSRQQEIKANLPPMIKATNHLDGYQRVVAGAPSIDDDFYAPFLRDNNVQLVRNQTYALLAQSTAALVTSGTATLETALFGVPQVVCYKTGMPHLARLGFKYIVKCRFISLVNLIADREVVPELMAERFSVKNIRDSLMSILPGGDAREAQLSGYREVKEALGNECAPDNAARLITSFLSHDN